jgi:hypothetical protein
MNPTIKVSKSHVRRAGQLAARALILLLFVKLLLDLLHHVHREKVYGLANDAKWRTLHEPKGLHYLKSESCEKRNDTLITPSNFAFVFGALGGYAKFEAFKCALAVESLVKIARYDGEVYIITEKTQHTCIPPEAELRVRTGSQNIHVIHHNGHDSASDPTATPRGFKEKPLRRYLRDMSVKMDIFYYLPTHIHIAAWYDCDVVFAVDNCANDNLLCSFPQFSELYPIYNTWDAHVGSFMVHRTFSAKLLSDWKREFLSGTHISDYPALKYLYDNQGNVRADKKWEYGRFVSGNFVMNSFSSDTRVLRAEAEHGETLTHWRDVIWDKETPNSCIMHLTGGRCSKKNNGPVATDALIATLGLDTPNGIKYCSTTPRKIVLHQGMASAFGTCYWPLL